MTLTRLPIATSNQLATSIMGRIGKGPADRANLIGAIVDKGYDFHHADSILDDTLGAMVDKAWIERVEVPSAYASGQTYAVWRLPASTPIDASAPRTGAGTVPPGHVSPEAYRAASQKSRRKS
jgi:hypothetical protein